MYKIMALDYKRTHMCAFILESHYFRKFIAGKKLKKTTGT